MRMVMMGRCLPSRCRRVKALQVFLLHVTFILLTWSSVILATTHVVQTPDELSQDPRCPPTNCQRPVCDSGETLESELRWTRFWWEAVDAWGNLTGFWCRGCQVCMSQCPDYSPCTIGDCLASVHYQWVTNFWCPLCESCNAPPSQISQNSACPTFSCPAPSCAAGVGTVPSRFWYGVHWCPGCPVCESTCVPLQCVADPDTDSCAASRQLVHAPNWYDNTWCPGCAQCVSGAPRAPGGSAAGWRLVVLVAPLLVLHLTGTQ